MLDLSTHDTATTAEKLGEKVRQVGGWLYSESGEGDARSGPGDELIASQLTNLSDGA